MKPITRIRTRGWLGPGRSVDEPARTLPLFRDPQEDPSAGQGDDDPNEPRDRVMQVYWSAFNEMVALSWAARRAKSPEQRQALYRLYAFEVQRKELARGLLASIWGIYFNPRREAEPRHHVDRCA